MLQFYKTLNMPTPAPWSTQENSKFTTILVVLTHSYCVDIQANKIRKICQIFEVNITPLCWKTFETICIYSKWTLPFMGQSFIAGSAILCHIMLNNRTLWGSSLIHSIPSQKLLCNLKQSLHTSQSSNELFSY